MIIQFYNKSKNIEKLDLNFFNKDYFCPTPSNPTYQRHKVINVTHPNVYANATEIDALTVWYIIIIN
eukprot:Pgem_evm1s17115